MTERVYELTTNKKDGYAKWMVRGIKSDDEAKKIALEGFGKEFYSTLISYYSDYPSKYGDDQSDVLTISQFLKEAKKHYKR